MIERALEAYHRAEPHGGTATVAPSALDDLLAKATGEAFAAVDHLPDDDTVFAAVRGAELGMLGEGYHDVLAGDPDAARDWQERFRAFVQQLWAHGISHLDFSVLNVGVVGGAGRERLVLFDPHMGAIELCAGEAEIDDPMAGGPDEERSLDDLLRAARDGSRWAMWHVQELAGADADVSEERVSDAAELVREFHPATEDEHGEGTFSRARFVRSWHSRGVLDVNDVARAQLDALRGHPLLESIRAAIEAPGRDEVYDRRLAVLGFDGRELSQFRARLRVHEQRPLVLVANVADTDGGLAKHCHPRQPGRAAGHPAGPWISSTRPAAGSRARRRWC